MASKVDLVDYAKATAILVLQDEKAWSIRVKCEICGLIIHPEPCSVLLSGQRGHGGFPHPLSCLKCEAEHKMHREDPCQLSPSPPRAPCTLYPLHVRPAFLFARTHFIRRKKDLSISYSESRGTIRQAGVLLASPATRHSSQGPPHPQPDPDLESSANNQNLSGEGNSSCLS